MRCRSNRLFVGVLVCCTSLLATGCYNMNGYVMNASGHGYYDQGNYAMAAREFESALQSNPYNSDYMANLAKAKGKMGDQQTAERMFRQALATTPSHQPSYHGLAELMIAQGRGEEASRMVNTWAATQPYVAESHVELAWVQNKLGQSHAAAQSLQRALQVNPSHATALAHLGQYYQEIGQPAQAVAMYQQSLQSNWNQPEVHSQIAIVSQAAGQNHPMSEMAMARGMHPESLAVQSPIPGRMAAGPQMVAQPQFAQQFPGQAPIAASPSMMAGTTGQPVPPFVPYQTPTAATSQPHSVQMAAQPAVGLPGFNPFVPMGIGGGTVDMNGGVSEPTLNTTPQSVAANPPAPVPDPAFARSESGTAATPVSQPQPVAEVPEVTAF